MSELLYVMRNKNKYQKEEAKQRKLEIDALREDGLFRVALNNELNLIKNIFADPTITAVELEVDDANLVSFGKSFGYEEMQSYQIRQKQRETNVFIITKKEIDLY